MASIDLSEYKDCIFVIYIDRSNSNSKILGTFFSKEKFTFNSPITGQDISPITGEDIIYLPTTEDEKSYNYDNNDINILDTNADNNVYFVHTGMNTPTTTSTIYSVNIFGHVTIIDKTGISNKTNLKNIIPVDSFELSTSIEGIEINQISDDVLNNKADEISALIDEISALIDKNKKTINELSSMLQGGMQRGGTNDEKKTKFKTVIYKFKDFVNRFITDSIIFQINSLNAEQINGLFNIKYTINMDNSTNTTRNQIKKPLFDNIYSDCFDFYEKGNYVINKEEDLEEVDNYTSYKATYLFIFKPLIEVITRDTTMYNIIINVPNVTTETKQIHIYQIANQFINFYNNDYDYLNNNKTYFNGIIDNIYTIINGILERFNAQINVNIQNNNFQSITVIDIIKIFHASTNQNFRNDLGNQLQKNASDKIITYVKINNFEIDQYNKRFDILIKRTLGANNAKLQNAMIVGYNDHNFPYYIKGEKDKLVLNEEKLMDKNYFKIERDKLTVEKYKNKYLFGNYTQIFKPEKSNPDIAKQMDVIIEQVKSGKPVFMLGYGASGSGKTSSLIYFNKGGKDETKNGILIHLCNILAKEGYTKIEMTAKEYFTVTGEKPDNYCKGNNEINDPIHCDTNKFTFTYDGNFKLDKDNEHKSTHEYRVESSPMVKFNQYDDMGKVMIYLIDKDRFVKATTNNPQSSRSHSMIYLKLTHIDTSTSTSSSTPKPPGYIIVGDYAGVENEFTCKNASTIIDFLEKNRDCGENECVPYYSEEYIPAEEREMNITFDSFNGKENGIKITDNAIANIYKNTDTIQQMISKFIKDNPDCKNMLYNIFFNETDNDTKYNINMDDPEFDLDDLVYNFFRNDTSYLENSIVKFKAFQTHINNTITRFKLKLQVMNKMIGGALGILEYFKRIKLDNNLNLKQYLINAIDTRNTEMTIIKEKINKSNDTTVMKDIDYLHQTQHKLLSVTNLKNNEIHITYSPENDPVFIYNFLLEKLKNMSSTELKNIYKILNPESLIKNVDEKVLNTFKILFTKIYSDIKPIFVTNTQSLSFNTIHNSSMDEITYNKYVNQIIKYYINTDIYNNELDKRILAIKNKNHNLLINNEKKIYIYDETINYTNLNNSFIKYSENIFLDDIIKNDYFSSLYINTQSLTRDKKIDAITNVIELQVEYFEKIFYLYDEIRTRFNYGKQICANRVFEGKFINESLRQIRENIKDIITVKSQDKVFNSPDYIDICLEQYCPTHADCFKTNPIADTTKLEIKSVLIKSIYEYIKTDKDTEYTIEQFYKDILISIFCVFNISRQANNPPPVPYMDINDLKIDVAIYKSKEDEEIKNKIIKHLTKLYYKLNNGTKLTGDSADYSVETTFEEHQVSVILSSNAYNDIYRDNKMFEVFNIETIKEFIETIDNNNAVSAIGTLEFVDQIAKYNTTNTICSSNKIEEEKVRFYNNVHRFDNLYQKTT